MDYAFSWVAFSLIIITLRATTPINQPSDIQANKCVFTGGQITPSMVKKFQRTFQMTYSTTPMIVYGINDYGSVNLFVYANFQSSISQISQTGFVITVILQGQTNVTLFSIGYLSFQPQASFMTDFQNVTNGANISTVPSITTSNSLRYYQNKVSLKFDSALTKGYPLITGFYLTSVQNFSLNITISILSSKGYQFTLQTSSDCAILRVTFTVFFYQPQLICDDDYFINASYIASNDPNANSFTYPLQNYSETVFMLGLAGFGGKTSSQQCQWGWQQPSGTNNGDAVTLNFYKNNLQFLRFSFIQIGKYSSPINCSNQTIIEPSPPTPSGNSPNYLIIITICLVIFVIVGIVMIARFCVCKNGVENNPIGQQSGITVTEFEQLPVLGPD